MIEEKRILKENELQANKFVAAVMRVTFLILTLVFLLNVFGVFVINKRLMTGVYIVGMVLLLLPTLLVDILKQEENYVKYVNVISSAVFVTLLCVTLTYHAVVIYVYPIAIASLYFSKELNILSTILTVIGVSAGQYIAFYIDTIQDDNFIEYHSMVVYGIIPRALILIAIAVIFTTLCTRTKKLLANLINAAQGLSKYHNEMVMGFATLVENKDGSTGGHIKRTSMYVRLLSEELIKRDCYSEILSDDYVENLCKAAPMHDIGKISVPDVILQKPGKLTDEEFEIMKQHAVRGGEIIMDTFGHLENEQYTQMAYEVARYHHEKWNGRGYPEGLKRKEIPVGARIMAIADVFDAVSMKRCYRDAMPLDKCFEIISEGSGTDFDPLMVEAFLDIRDKIEAAYREVSS